MRSNQTTESVQRRGSWPSRVAHAIPDRWAGPGQLGLDLGGWAASIGIIAKLSGTVESTGSYTRLVVLVAATLFILAVSGLSMGLYRQRWRFGSMDEIAAVLRTAFATGFALIGVNALSTPHVLPMAVSVSGGFVGLVAMFGVRYIWRLVFESGQGPDASSAARTIVFGAGEAGSEVVRSMKRNPRSPYLPVAFLDDEGAKQRHEVSHVRVMGTRNDLARVAREMKATTLLIAMPSAPTELVTYLNNTANSIGLDVKILPPLEELFNREVGENDIRNISETDLLGRRQIKTDISSIAGYLRGQRVLVTGAGGSIGSELCRQIARYEPEALLMLDRDESALHSVQMSIEGRALLDSPNLILADIRDRDHMFWIFEEYAPQVVFHAAALEAPVPA